MSTNFPKPSDEWRTFASGVVMEQLAQAGISQAELRRRLSRMELYISYPALHRKLAHGGFSAGFLLQVLVAMGAEALVLPTSMNPDGSMTTDVASVADRIEATSPAEGQKD